MAQDEQAPTHTRASLSTIRVKPGRLTLALSLLSLVTDDPIRLQSIFAYISARHGLYFLLTEPFSDMKGQILQPYSPYQATHDFVVSQSLPPSNPPEVPRLMLQAVFGLQGAHRVSPDHSGLTGEPC
jgi:hypothetical protein